MSWFWWGLGVLLALAVLGALLEKLGLVQASTSKSDGVKDQSAALLTQLKRMSSETSSSANATARQAPPYSHNAIELASIELNVSVVVGKPGDPQTRELIKRATDHKMEKRWPEAIACLRSAIQRMDVSPDFFGARDRARLPQYMQLSGDFEGAWREFQHVLDKLDTVNYLRFCRRGVPEAEALRMDEKALVLEKMIGAAKRAKRPDLMAQAEQQLEQLHAPRIAAKSRATLARMRADIQKFRSLSSAMFPRVKWSAIRDGRCHKACAALDGKTWAVDDPALDAVVERHHSEPIEDCRCLLVLPSKLK